MLLVKEQSLNQSVPVERSWRLATCMHTVYIGHSCKCEFHVICKDNHNICNFNNRPTHVVLNGRQEFAH